MEINITTKLAYTQVGDYLISRDDGAKGSHRGTESRRSDAVGAGNERHPRDHRGDHPKRTDL